MFDKIKTENGLHHPYCAYGYEEWVKNKTHQSHCICRELEKYDAWVEKNRPAVEWPQETKCASHTKYSRKQWMVSSCGGCLSALAENKMRDKMLAAYERARKGEG